MQTSGRLRNKRTLAVGGLAGVLVATGVFVVTQFRNTTTPVATEAAIERFESAGPAASEGARDTYGDSTESADREVITTTSPTSPLVTVAEEASAPGVVEQPETAATDVTVPDASAPAESSNVTRLTLPEPGVYRLSVTGSESIDLLTGASHAYPGDGFLTVTTTECGVSLRSDFIVERWQSIDVCDGPDGPTLVGEQIFHSFFGQDDLVIRTCEDSPIALGVTSWSCEGEASVAQRAVATEIDVRQLPDGTQLDVLIITSELVLGDQPGNVESIEQWWDLESGLPIYESRSYDFTLETPLGDAEYVEEYEAVLPSLTPVS